MTIERKLLGTVDATATEAVYIEDVMATYLYTGNGSSQTITNGIDLATKGGLVWLKSRSAIGRVLSIDTVRGTNKTVATSSTLGESDWASTDTLNSFNTNGFTLGAGSGLGQNNTNADTYASWTFRKQAKFFTCLTYSGNGANRTISHDLGAVPGMIIVKRTNAASNWQVYHRSLTSAANSIQLNLTSAQASATTVWNSTAPTSSVFSVGTDATVNASGGTYVAYLFAHDAGGFGPAGTDSVVACGSYTGTGSDQNISLGWEPQFVLVKPSNQSGWGWYVFDNMRGLNNTSVAYLEANTSGAETTGGSASVTATATGFRVSGSSIFGANGYNNIYLAIRRGPMRTPTDATKVFAPITSSDASGTKLTTGFPVDLQIFGLRTATTNKGQTVDRLRGVSTNSTESGAQLITTSTSAETTTSVPTLAWDNTGFQMTSSYAGSSNIFWNFARAPGFFDVVCFSSSITTNQRVSHNLSAVPHLIIAKERNASGQWWVYSSTLGRSLPLRLSQTGVGVSATNFWGTSDPTSTDFGIDTSATGSGYTTGVVAYLFATCPGVSKCGSYTGNGSSQTIDCGFASGARFVLIKRTDSTGDWYVWDTARGIVSGNDPRLSLNTTAAEVTTDDSIDPASSGFIVNQLSATNINVSSATYIYLAIA